MWQAADSRAPQRSRFKQAPLQFPAMLRVGKHRGKAFEEVCEDKSYVSWVLRQDPTPQSFAGLVKHIKKEYGGIMTCGKHRDKWFTELDADYKAWALDQETPGALLKPLVSYLKETEAPSASSPQSTCKICFDAEVKIAFVPCGHSGCCERCGTKFVGKPCAFCKRKVKHILKLYNA